MEVEVGVTIDKCEVLVGYKYMVCTAQEESVSRAHG